MRESCEVAGGFYYDGMCALGITKKKTEASEYHREVTSAWQSKNSFSSSNSNSQSTNYNTFYKEDMQTGLVLPGVQLTCDSKISNWHETSYSNSNGSSSVLAFNQSSSGTSTRDETSNYSVSNEISIVQQKNSEVGIIAGCPSFSFVPVGWEAVITQEGCIQSNPRIVMPENNVDPLTLIMDRVYKQTGDFVKEYKVGDNIVKRVTINNSGIRTEEKVIKDKKGKDQKKEVVSSFSIGTGGKAWCRPKGFILNHQSQFPEIETQWYNIFK
jgi:hypothetical protein